MISSYAQMWGDIEWLRRYLATLDIDAAVRSHLEDDYLSASDFVENYEAGSHSSLTEKGRCALGGLHELYKWVASVKSCPEFSKLIPHLRMLSESATRINSATPMLNPVTKKQDDKTNKLIETIVSMYAVKVGRNVDIDDPIESSGGRNPDVLFDFRERRIAFACKTLRSDSTNSIRDNLISAAKQIERAECDLGYIAVNAMNVLPHAALCDSIFPDYGAPLRILMGFMSGKYAELKTNGDDLKEILRSPKVAPEVLTFVHSTTQIQSSAGRLSTMLKATYAFNLLGAPREMRDLSLLDGVNEFIHNRL